MRESKSELLSIPMSVLRGQERFWTGSRQSSLLMLLRYSFFLGFFPFAGYLVNYTIRGTIWNVWPFVQTTVDVASGLVFAGLQWIFFGIFPVVASLIVEAIHARLKRPIEFEDCVMVTTYSITPLCLSMLFVGVPYFDRILTTLGFASFLFLLYHGFRMTLGFTILRSVSITFLVFVLFALIRQMFVFAIGY